MGLLKALVVLSAKNDFKSELGGLVDSSVFRRTSVSFKGDSLVCATLPLPLSYRLGPHVASDVIQDGRGEVSFYRDDGTLATVHAATGAYAGTVAAAAPSGVVANSLRNGTFLALDRGRLASVRLAGGAVVASCAVPNRTDATAGGGAWWAASGGGGAVVVAANHRLAWPLDHPARGAVHVLAPAASGACGVDRSLPLPTVNDSFCGAAYDAKTATVYALVETHDISQFPDPDCQNLSGTVVKVKIVAMTATGGYEELADVPGGGALSGSPAMLRGDAWLVQRGGGLYAFNTTSRAWSAQATGACASVLAWPAVLA